MKTLFVVFASLSIAQELPKIEPKKEISPIAKLEYFQAESAEKSAKSKHDELMENIKKAVAESVTNQIQATVKVLIANSKLQQECAELNSELDQKALQAGEVKCVEKPKESKQ
jgi:hypothetical protein